MDANAHIVVVDDDEAVRETLSEYLADHGFRITALEGAGPLREMVDAGEQLDLVLLDITMPGEDGLSAARFLREHSDAGIIMVTASGETVDRIVGIEIGADDYLPKPVDLRELLARIKAVLRRSTAMPKATASRDREHELVSVGRCMLDLDAHTLHDEDGSEVPISSMEFELLKTFAERPNRVLSREQLLDLAHDRDTDPFDRSIDIRIARIRRKIEIDPGKPRVIKTVRGAGYVFSTK